MRMMTPRPRVGPAVGATVGATVGARPKSAEAEGEYSRNIFECRKPVARLPSITPTTARSKPCSARQGRQWERALGTSNQ